MQQPGVIKGSDLITIDIPISHINSTQDSLISLANLIRRATAANGDLYQLLFPVADAERRVLVPSLLRVVDAQRVNSGAQDYEGQTIIRFYLHVKVIDFTIGVYILDAVDVRRIAYQWIIWELSNIDEFKREFYFLDSDQYDRINMPTPFSLVLPQ